MSHGDKKMSTPLGRRIKMYREQLGISQSELGKQLGLTRASISQYELGAIKEMKMGQLVKMAKALRVDAEELATGLPSKTGALVRQEIFFVPVISIDESVNLSAGTDSSLFEGREHMAVTVKIKKGFALEIFGDEMVSSDSPVRVGGFVAFDAEAVPESGDCVLVKIKNQPTPLFRQLRITGSRHLLRPMNPQFQATETTGDAYKVLGVARQFITKM